MEHRHHGKSSANFLDADEILSELNLKGNESFLDAGCGDGYVSIKAIEEYLPDGTVYALDSYDVAIEELENLKNENNFENLIAVEADLTETIPIGDESIDVVLMLNVFHGFAADKIDDVIKELKRIIKSDGKIAIMDFKAIELPKGPPLNIKKSPKELEDLFKIHNLKITYLNEDIGEDIPEGKSHYLIIFERE